MYVYEITAPAEGKSEKHVRASRIDDRQGIRSIVLGAGVGLRIHFRSSAKAGGAVSQPATRQQRTFGGFWKGRLGGFPVEEEIVCVLSS